MWYFSLPNSILWITVEHLQFEVSRSRHSEKVQEKKGQQKGFSLGLPMVGNEATIDGPLLQNLLKVGYLG